MQIGSDGNPEPNVTIRSESQFTDVGRTDGDGDGVVSVVISGDRGGVGGDCRCDQSVILIIKVDPCVAGQNDSLDRVRVG